MRKFMIAAALAAGFSAAGAMTPAQAITITAPAGLSDAGGTTNNVTQARYVCRRWWAYGRWHRRCYWRPDYYRHRHHRYWHHHRWYYY
jgi:hypothetical protein